MNGWTYNSNNQVTVANPQGGLAGLTGITYDAAGNLTAANGMTLTYDPWGRLSSVSNTPSGTVSFTYDAFGRRVSKTVGSTTTYYLYSAEALIAEVDANGNVLRSYNWGALGLISDRAGSTSQFYLYDGSGNTRFLVSANGTVLSRGAYTAWGTPLSGLSPNTAFAYNGHFGVYRDSETGLLLMGARYYAPAIGRFITRDPIGYAGGINLYVYCGDPINFADPSGLSGQLSFLQFLEEAGAEVGTAFSEAGEALVEAGEVIVEAGEVVVEGTAVVVSLPVTATVAVGAAVTYGVFSYAGAVNAENAAVTTLANQPFIRASNPQQAAAAANSQTNCPRPDIKTRLPDRVIKALPEGVGRTPAEDDQARNFFKRNRGAARKWWEDRTGQAWPANTTHDEHLRPLKDGGDPLYIEPGFKGPAGPHKGGDFSRWGKMGGRPRKNRGF